MNTRMNPDTGKWEECVPEPYYYSFLQWSWKRITGWRDKYNRKAQLILPWE